MSGTEEHPPKRRRFFEPPSPEPPRKKKNLIIRAKSASRPPDDDAGASGGQGEDVPMGFDVATLAAVIGEELSEAKLHILSEAAGGNLERAINMYFDGTFTKLLSTSAAFGSLKPMTSKRKSDSPGVVVGTGAGSSVSKRTSEVLEIMPAKRYIGAFGVGAWATRSGLDMLRHNERVKIERQKIQTPAISTKRKNAVAQRKTHDIVVRFTNKRGEEIGRLPQDSALFVSTLIDQNICSFEGICVYAPERIRTNDTIYLQLRCFLLKVAFESGGIRPADSNRIADLFAAKETEDEKRLRLRQVSLVKLFTEMNLQPLSQTAVMKDQRSEILQAAELAEQKEQEAAAAAANIVGVSDDSEEGKELEQDQLDTLYKKAQSFDFDSPEADPPDTFAMTLRPYQKQALHWLLNKEKNLRERQDMSIHPLWEEYLWPTRDENDRDIVQVEGMEKFYVNPYSGELSIEFPRQEQNCLGGILADEMGLGKTIEMLALVHSHKIEVAPRSSGEPGSSPKKYPRSSNGVEQAPYTTLVVAPMSLIAQWQSEAEAASKPGTLSSYVYYGTDKKASLKNLCSVASGARAPNLVITSYGTVLSEYNGFTAANGDRDNHQGLFSLNFFRIILDEAHHIKNRTSKTAKACYELNAEHRWVLTGTPIVNRLEDLFSLVRFLRVEPWNNFSFWKTFITLPFEAKDFIRALDVVQTVLEPLVLRRTKDMKRPDGEPLVPLPSKTTIIEKVTLSKRERELYDYIQDRVKKAFTHNLEAGTVMRAYTTILAQILRLRQSCCHPTLIKKKEILHDELEAEAAYDAATGLSDDMDLNALIDRFSDEAEQNETARGAAATYGAHVLQQIRDEADGECPICCNEPMDCMVVTGCFHAACKSCLLGYIEHEREKGKLPLCVTCREPINERDVFEIVREDSSIFVNDGGGGGDDDGGDGGDGGDSPNQHQHQQKDIFLRRVLNRSSAKIDALMGKLKSIRKAEPATKSCIFSQFTSFLSLLEPALQRERIPFVRFDGSMAQQARADVLAKFKLHEGNMVILISLRAGGVGLNLTEASHVFMMDPWWSFAVEAQAIDRIHRMGQTRPVTVHRFIVEGSVEERMINKIQARKKFIASSLGMMNDEEKRQQRLEDIKDLLSD